MAPQNLSGLVIEGQPQRPAAEPAVQQHLSGLVIEGQPQLFAGSLPGTDYFSGLVIEGQPQRKCTVPVSEDWHGTFALQAMAFRLIRTLCTCIETARRELAS